MEKYWGGKSAFYILKWINSSHIYLNINIYCVRSITVLKDRTWVNVLSLCSGSPAAEPPAAQHIILYTHTLKRIWWIRLTPGCQHEYRNVLHIFITSTRNQINQQINSLLMEAACWWRRPGDGGGPLMEAARPGQHVLHLIHRDGWLMVEDHILLDHRTTSYWTTGSHQNTSNTTRNTSRWTVRRSTGDHSRSAARRSWKRPTCRCRYRWAPGWLCR